MPEVSVFPTFSPKHPKKEHEYAFSIQDTKYSNFLFSEKYCSDSGLHQILHNA